MYQRRAKRYLGMTTIQLLVLGGLFLAVCCVLVGGLTFLNFLAGTVFAPAVPQNFNLPSPLPTFTPGPTDTPLPTSTPTEIPYESLIPSGWKQFTSPDAPGMEIWLPASYVPSGQIKNTHEIKLIDTGSADVQIKYLLGLTDQTQSPYLIYTSFDMGIAPMTDATLDDLIDRVFGAMMRSSRLMERGNYVIGNYDARKLVLETSANGVDAAFVFYLIRVEDTVWYQGFVAPFNELDARLPVFDQIMQTFRLSPVTPTPTMTPTVPPSTNTPLP